MTKQILLLLTIFSCLFAYSQNVSQDSSDLSRVSSQEEEQMIDFYWNGGSLIDALDKLTGEYKIKISYSPGKLINISAREKKGAHLAVSEILNSLLKDSGYTYVVVGRVFVIVRDEKKEEENFPVTDSNTTTAPLTPKEKPSGSHVYPGSPVVQKLPLKERLKIYQIYKEELKWAAKQKKITGRIAKDTLEAEPTHSKDNYKLMTNSCYFSGTVGLQSFHLKYKNNSDLNWEEDLQYEDKARTAFYPAFTTGILLKNFILVGVGAGVQSLNVHGHWTEIVKKVPAIPPKNKDTFNYSFSDRYTIVSVPCQILLFKQKKKFFAAAGPGFILNGVKVNKGDSYRFERYYQEKNKDQPFSEKLHKVLMMASVEVQGGMIVKQQLLWTAGFEYRHSLTPIAENSVYRFYSNSMLVKTSVTYFFSLKKELRPSL